MLTDKLTAPCRGCADRWVNEEGTCHSKCEKYKDFKAAVAEKNEIIYAEKKNSRDPRMDNFSDSQKNLMLKRRKK